MTNKASKEKVSIGCWKQREPAELQQVANKAAISERPNGAHVSRVKLRAPEEVGTIDRRRTLLRLENS